MSTAPKLLPVQDFDELKSSLMQTPEASALMNNIIAGKLNFNELDKRIF